MRGLTASISILLSETLPGAAQRCLWGKSSTDSGACGSKQVYIPDRAACWLEAEVVESLPDDKWSVRVTVEERKEKEVIPMAAESTSPVAADHIDG